MRGAREKPCHHCHQAQEVMYRCRTPAAPSWVFVCGACLLKLKSQYEDRYHYGGTPKAKKKEVDHATSFFNKAWH